MIESVVSEALAKKGDIADIVNIISILDGKSADYIGSRESLDTARAVMHFVNESATETDRALLGRSPGAVTLLTAIEGNTKAWDSVKVAAVKDSEYRVSRGFDAPQVQNAESGVRNDVDNRTVGLIMNDAATKLDKGVRVNIQTFAERTGSTVVLQHGLIDENGKVIMGEEKDGVIKINADYTDVVHSIAVHEFTHRILNIAPKASEKFRNYVVSKMKNEGTYEGAMAKLREDYQGLSDEKLIDELCAETAERLFQNEAELTGFIKKDRTLAEWVKDAWIKVLDKLGRTDERTHAQLMWKKCMKEAASAKNKDVKIGEVRYKKEYSFNKQVDDALDNKTQRGYSVYVGRLPKLLEKCGLNPELPMLMHPSHIRDINHEKSPDNIHYHGIPSEIIKQIPDLIKYPAMIYDSISEDNSSNSICILTTQCNEDGAPIVIIITNSEQNGKYLDVKMEIRKTDASNHVDTMYGKDGFGYHMDSVIENDAILYVSKDGLNKLLNRKNLRLNSDGKLRLLARLDNLRFDTIIHQSRNVVNTKSIQNGENDSTSSQKRPGVSEKLDEYMSDFGEVVKSKDVKSLQEENAELRKQLENVSLFNISRSAGLGAEIRRAAMDLKSGYGSKMNVSEIQKELTGLYNYMVGKDARNDTEVVRRIHDLAERVIAQSTETVVNEEYGALLERIKTARIHVPESERADFGDGYEHFRKHNMGKITLANDGIELDALWEELCEEYPNLFDEGVTGSEDRLERMLEVREEFMPAEESIYHTEKEYRGAVLSLANDIMESFFRIPESDGGNRLVFYGRNAPMKDKALEESMDRATARKISWNKSEVKKRIDSDYRYLSKMVTDPTDARHVPEDMRASVAFLLGRQGDGSETRGRFYCLTQFSQQSLCLSLSICLSVLWITLYFSVFEYIYLDHLGLMFEILLRFRILTLP